MLELNQYFTDKEIEIVKNGEQFIEHPLKPFFQYNHSTTHYENEYGYIYEKIACGIRLASVYNAGWYEGVKKRLLYINPENASSALSELRTYGCLKQLEFGGYEIEPHRPQKHSSSDFTLISKDETIVVETYCKQMNGEMLKRLKEFEKEKPTDGIKAISVTPFGAPKQKENTAGKAMHRENTTENVIHSLAQMKPKEEQASDDFYSILWIDMQDDSLRRFVNPSSALPMRSWNGNFNSGELWYSCYGEKGLPILEGEHYIEFSKMQHDGRFSKEGSRYDCFVFSLPNATILFENPYSQKNISKYFRYWSFRLPWFKLEYSWLRFPHDDLAERIRLEKERIISFYEFMKKLT